MLLRILAALLIAIGGLIIVCNWLTSLQTHRSGRNHSAIPLFGVAFTGTRLWLLYTARHWAWVPFLADDGTLLLLVALPTLAYQEWQTSRFNLLTEYQGQRDILTARARLFRRGHCTVVDELRLHQAQWGC